MRVLLGYFTQTLKHPGSTKNFGIQSFSGPDAYVCSNAIYTLTSTKAPSQELIKSLLAKPFRAWYQRHPMKKFFASVIIFIILFTYFSPSTIPSPTFTLTTLSQTPRITSFPPAPDPKIISNSNQIPII